MQLANLETQTCRSQLEKPVLSRTLLMWQQQGCETNALAFEEVDQLGIV